MGGVDAEEPERVLGLPRGRLDLGVLGGVSRAGVQAQAAVELAGIGDDEEPLEVLGVGYKSSELGGEDQASLVVERQGLLTQEHPVPSTRWWPVGQGPTFLHPWRQKKGCPRSSLVALTISHDEPLSRRFENAGNREIPALSDSPLTPLPAGIPPRFGPNP